jgi:hypothetical protein
MSDDPKYNDCASEVEVEVVPEKLLKRRRTSKSANNNNKNSKQMRKDELAAHLNGAHQEL